MGTQEARHSHTHTPWYRRGPLSEDDSGIAGGVAVDIVAADDDGGTWNLLDDLSVEDADFIVTAANHHDALIAVCREFVAWEEWDGDGPALKSLPAILATMRSLLQSATGAPEDVT